jgi:flavorubredoxin
MPTTIDEIAPDVFRIATFISEVAAPAGFTFNQFLIRDEDPFLYHTGMRAIFPSVSEAVGRLIDLDDLRWISFAHVEADECGAMNAFLAAAPRAEVIHGQLACAVSLNDLCDRPPRAVDDGEVVELGRHRLRFLATPHVPHNWESALWCDDATGTMFVGDLFSQTGNPAPVTSDDIVEAAIEAEAGFQSISGGPQLTDTLRRLAELAPHTLAVMHGSSYRGNTADAFDRLAHRLGAANARS